MSMKGKVAFVTGGGAGIGYAIAQALGKEGASIVIADIDAAVGATAARKLSEAGISAIAISCDVADAEGVENATTEAIGALGGIDFLINNAGLHLPRYAKPVTELDLESWRQLLNVNVLGIVHCARACRASMRERGGGVIINISSMASFKGESAYGISKQAVNGLTVALARDLGSEGTRVVGIAPGLMESEAAVEHLTPEFRARYVRDLQLIKRPGQVDDIASVARFLCSAEASFITAETILVSGGAFIRP